MKNIYLSIVIIFLTQACQIEDDNAPAPDESFIKYYGTLTGYEAKDIEFLSDSSGFIIFGNVVGIDGTTDYTLIRVSQDGALIDSIIFSFDIPLRGIDADGNGEFDDVLAGDDDASQVEVFDGGFAVIGTTSLNNSVLDILDVQVATITFFDNEFNNLLDTTFSLPAGDLRDGLDLLGADIITLSDGAFLVMGSIEVDRGGGVSDMDYFLFKIGSANEGDDFQEIIGVPGAGNDEMMVRGFEKNNGNIVFIGYSSDPSDLGENNGNNGLNVTYTELNSQGQLLNTASYGIDNPEEDIVFNEVVTNVIETTSGFAITGTSTLSTDDNYAFFMNLTSSGVFIEGDTLTSSFNPGLESRGFGIVQTRDDNFIVLGDYDNFNIVNALGQQESRAGEAMFMKINQVGQPISGCETNYGTANGDDTAVDALVLPSGKIVVLANVDFGGGVKLISLIKTDDNGQLEN